MLQRSSQSMRQRNKSCLTGGIACTMLFLCSHSSVVYFPANPSETRVFHGSGTGRVNKHWTWTRNHRTRSGCGCSRTCAHRGPLYTATVPDQRDAGNEQWSTHLEYVNKILHNRPIFRIQLISPKLDSVVSGYHIDGFLYFRQNISMSYVEFQRVTTSRGIR
jgi:hypothetical protein